MVLAFLVFAHFLAWKVGNGRLVSIRADAILGCGNGIFLPKELTQQLHDQGLFTLNQIVDQDSTDLWQHGMGLQRHFSNLWTTYLDELKKGHVRIKEESECLGWWMIKIGGNYTTRLGYIALPSDVRQDTKWSWTKLWKIRAPKKYIIHMWLALSNRVLTWELLQKRQVQVPSYCILCKNNEETISHLAIFFPFTCQVWLEISKSFGLGNVWSGDSIEHCLQFWFQRQELKENRAIPVLVLWTIW